MTPRSKVLAGLLAGALLLTFDVLAAETLVISQKKRMFTPNEITIHRGDTLNITNDDNFTHQVYVDSDRFKFDSNESDPGMNVEIKFTTAGEFDVLCHIHPKMKLHVTVQ